MLSFKIFLVAMIFSHVLAVANLDRGSQRLQPNLLKAIFDLRASNIFKKIQNTDLQKLFENTKVNPLTSILYIFIIIITFLIQLN